MSSDLLPTTTMASSDTSSDDPTSSVSTTPTTTTPPSPPTPAPPPPYCLVQRMAVDFACVSCGNPTHSYAASSPSSSSSAVDKDEHDDARRSDGDVLPPKPLETTRSSKGICLRCDPPSALSLSAEAASVASAWRRLSSSSQGRKGDDGAAGEDEEVFSSNDDDGGDVETGLRRAETLCRRGVDRVTLGEKGGGETAVEDAASCFARAVGILRNLVPVRDGESTRIRLALIRTWTKWAQLNMLLHEWDEARRLLVDEAGLASLEKWVHEAAAAASPSSGGDGGDYSFEALLLLAELHRDLSIVDEKIPERAKASDWDRKGMEVVQKLEAIDASNPEVRCLRATFSFFQSIDESDPTKAESLDAEAREILEDLTARHPDEPRYALRLAQACRIGSYTHREAKRMGPAADTARRAIRISTERLLRRYPTAPAFLIEAYRDHVALASHLAVSRGSGKTNDEQLFAELSAAATVGRLTDVLPTLTEGWRWRTETFLDVARLQESTMDNDDAARAAICRSLESAERAVGSPRADFIDQYNLCRALCERGRMEAKAARAGAANCTVDVLSFYERAHRVYTASVLSHPKGKDEFYVEQYCRAMDEAHEHATKVGDTDRAIAFISRAVSAAPNMKARKNRQLHANFLNQLAKLHRERGEPLDAIKFYHESLGICKPLLEQHPWHFFLGCSFKETHLGLAKAYQDTGDTAAEIRHRNEHLRQMARLQGKEFKQVIDDPCEASEADLQQIRGKCTEITTKKYLVPCYFRGADTRSPFGFYFTENFPGDDPLADQARTLEEDHDGIIPEGVRDSVRKLYQLAVKNNVSFLELLAYALDDDDLDEEKTSPAIKRAKSLSSDTSKLDSPMPDRDEDAILCVACMENERSQLFLPCRHMCLCVSCTKNYTKSKKDKTESASKACPICRTSIKEVVAAV